MLSILVIVFLPPLTVAVGFVYGNLWKYQGEVAVEPIAITDEYGATAVTWKMERRLASGWPCIAASHNPATFHWDLDRMGLMIDLAVGALLVVLFGKLGWYLAGRIDYGTSRKLKRRILDSLWLPNLHEAVLPVSDILRGSSRRRRHSKRRSRSHHD